MRRALTFTGPARIFESQEDAVDGILGDKVKPGDVVVIRYEGPKGGPGMQEMLYPTSYLKSKGLGEELRADHRRTLLRRQFRPLARPHLAGGGGGRRDRAARGGRPHRDRHPGARRCASRCRMTSWPSDAPHGGARSRCWQPKRDRVVSTALQAYAALTTSASRGAVRDVTQVTRRR